MAAAPAVDSETWKIEAERIAAMMMTAHHRYSIVAQDYLISAAVAAAVVVADEKTAVACVAIARAAVEK